jgi:hypothetical protein
MSRIKWNRTTAHRWSPRSRYEPTPEETQRAAMRRAAAKRGAVDIVKHGDGIPCPSCGNATERREHAAITAKMKRRPYFYVQWFICRHPSCRTTVIFRDEDRSDIRERLKQISEQLKVK